MRRLKRPLLVLLGLVLIAATAAGLWATWNALSTSRYEESLRRFREAGLPTSFRELAPAAVPESENAAPLYLRAIDRAAGIQEVRLESYEEIGEDIRATVAGAETTLQLLHDAAKRPRCVFDRDYEDPANAFVIGFAPFRKLASVLLARAAIRSGDGDLDGAIDDLRAFFHMARSLRDEPLLLSQIVRLLFVDMGLEALVAILPRFESAAEALRRIRLDDARGAIARALRGEGGFATDIMLGDSLDPSDLGDETSAIYWTVRMRSVTRPYLKSEAAAYLDFIRQRSDALQKGYPVAIAEAERLEEELQESGGFFLNAVVMQAASSVKREAQVVSKLALAPLAARCLDHRREHGEYPKSLAEVAPGPERIDPYSEKPFRLIPRPDGGITLESPDEGGGSWRLPE